MGLGDVFSIIKEHNKINVTDRKDYNENEGEFSMLKLETEIEWTAYPDIRPICLPWETDNNLIGKMVTVTGMGIKAVEEVEVKVVSNKHCGSKPEYEICAGGDKGRKGPCPIESGGPLVIAVAPDNYQLIGIVGETMRCEGSTEKKPHLSYPRVSEDVLKWINNVKVDGKECSYAVTSTSTIRTTTTSEATFSTSSYTMTSTSTIRTTTTSEASFSTSSFKLTIAVMTLSYLLL